VISQKSISEVLEIAKVEDIIDEFVSLKKRGVNLIGLCPFHNEKTPSFTVSPAKNMYKCFGCGKGGNTISFIMEHESYSFPEAIRYLAKKYSIQLDEDHSIQEDKQSAQEKESLFIINEFAQKYFHQQLLNTDEGKSVGLSYFKSRGFLLSTIIKFQLGYSPSDAKAFVNLAVSKGYKEEYLEKVGLKSKRGLDFFRSRIIFPITNLSGKIIAFGGRTLSKENKVPKYLNSPESDIYFKSKSLYGIYQAKTEMRRENNCYLVEGYTDVINLSQNEVINVIASSGTSLTDGQLRVIRRFCSTITFLYDGDEAGQKAALRGLPLALDQDFDVKIVALPEDQDPDSLMQNSGASSFKKMLIDSAKDFIIYRSKSINDKYGDLPIEKSNAIKEIIKIIAHIKDAMKRSIYIKEVCNLLEIDERSFLIELNKNIRNLIAHSNRQNQRIKTSIENEESMLSVKKEAESQSSFLKNDYFQERDIIRILLRDGQKMLGNEKAYTVADFIIENLRDVLDSFKNPTFRNIIQEYINNADTSSKIDISHFLSHDDQKVKDVVIELVQTPYEYAKWSEFGVELQTQKSIEENYEKDSRQAILRFKLKKLTIQIDELSKLLKKKDTDKKEKEVLLLTYSKIMAHRKNIADELGAIVL